MSKGKNAHHADKKGWRHQNLTVPEAYLSIRDARSNIRTVALMLDNLRVRKLNYNEICHICLEIGHPPPLWLMTQLNCTFGLYGIKFAANLLFRI